MPSPVKFPIKGPWRGIVSDVPVPNDPTSFDDALNVVFRKARIQTRPRLSVLGTPPDNAPIRYVCVLQDIVNSFHNVVLTTQHAYMVTPGPVWNLLTGYAPSVDLQTNLPYALDNVLSRLYFSNGSDFLNFIDGTGAVQKSGDTPGGCLFLAHNAGHLIQGYCIEPVGAGQRVFPRRLRWSVSGLQTGVNDDWTGFSSGFVDLLEISDVMTGLETIGKYTYVFRNNGIILMAPTGDALEPFTFENVGSSDSGIGNVFPYSLDVYNNSAVFISKDDIYLMTEGQSFEPIAGGRAKLRIFKDLASAAKDKVTGWIAPHLGPGYDFLAYYLSIPGPDVTWVYSREADAWTRFNSSKGWTTAIGTYLTS